MTHRRRTSQLRRVATDLAGHGRKTRSVVAPPVDLPVHFFTIVLNGEPFIRYHLDVLRQLPFRWHWHVVEGVAALVHDTAWSVAGGGRVHSSLHDDGLSNDGTTAYLDAIAALEPERISVYRKPQGTFWDGKREMVAAPLRNIDGECLLWQIDADELWTAEQITGMRTLFIGRPEHTSAYYWCDYFVGPDAVITTRYNYAENPGVEWLRTWRYRPGDRWDAHEPPTLTRRRWLGLGSTDVGKLAPLLHDETERAGAVFQHYAYATEEQVRFKEAYYGYDDAVDGWQKLQGALAGGGPVRLGDFLPWVQDETLADRIGRSRVVPIARQGRDGTWGFADRPSRTDAEAKGRSGAIVVDGVFFQHFSSTGVARVWRSLLGEWVRSGFAERIVFLDRGGLCPRIPGLPTRSLPPWRVNACGEDSGLLQRVCDEERAGLFVSTYYTAPISTPSLMLVYDMIPERLGLDMRDDIWEEKGSAIEHASAYVCISDNTRRDLLELEPRSASKHAYVVALGVDAVFRPAAPEEVHAFRQRHGLGRPYFMVVGERTGVDGYKNVQLLFRAFKEWSEASGHEIVCIGGSPEIEPDLTALAPRASTRRLDLHDEELRLAYAGAQALVYPSRYEGFGLPVVEAMASGCPVITTPVASLPEVAGDAALYVDPDDPAELVLALEAVRDPTRRSAMIRSGIDRAALFDWQEAARSFAARLSLTVEEDTDGARESRARTWQKRRETQAARERVMRARRPALTGSAAGRPRQRLTKLALRYLPAPVVKRLRKLKRMLTRRGTPGRRRG